MTFGGGAAATPSAPAPAPISSDPTASVNRRLCGFMASRLLYRQLGELEFRVLRFRFDIAKAQAAVRLRGIPRQGVSLWLRARDGQREHQRFRGVMGDVSRHLVM